MEDQPADPGVLTPDTDAPTPPAKPRRWWQLRRRAAAAHPESDGPAEPEAAEQPAETTEDAPAAARVPVGKRKRTPVVEATAKAADDEVAEDEPEDDPQAEIAAAEAEAQTKAEVAAEAETAPAEPDDTADEEKTDAGENPPAEESRAAETDEEPTESEPAEEPVLVPHRPADKRWIIAAAAASAVFVAAGAFAGAMAQPYLADRALVETKLEVARTASEAITTLWTYTPEDMENLPERAGKYLAGDFSEQYRRFIDAIVATNKQSQVTNSTEVVGTAVESITPTEASAIVYTNSVSTSPVSKNVPSLRYLSYRLSMERQNSEWLINRMTAITQLDLTPQL
ncbi:mammalian cell entry protein [Mycolicibacterium thermoresistibile]